MIIRATAPALLAASLLAAIASATVARAADVQAPDSTPFTPAAPVVYDWSGVYAGLSAGASWQNFDTLFGTPAVGTNFDAGGFTGGAFAGVNFQNGPFVYGVEADASFNLGDDTALVAGVPLKAESDWFATLRGRAGYAVDRYMFYGTGGLAVGDVKISAPAGSSSDTKVGWTLGAGVEAALTDSFTVRGEYLYTDLGKSSGRIGGTPFSTEFDSHTLRAGVTYKFK